MGDSSAPRRRTRRVSTYYSCICDLTDKCQPRGRPRRRRHIRWPTFYLQRPHPPYLLYLVLYLVLYIQVLEILFLFPRFLLLFVHQKIQTEFKTTLTIPPPQVFIFIPSLFLPSFSPPAVMTERRTCAARNERVSRYSLAYFHDP